MPSLSSNNKKASLTRSSPLQDPLLLQPSPETADNNKTNWQKKLMSHEELALAAQASAAAADTFIQEHNLASAAGDEEFCWQLAMEQEEDEEDEDENGHHHHHHHPSETRQVLPNNNNGSISQTMIWLGTTANLCSATLGCGVLALPAACAQTGLVLATCLTLVAAVATTFSIHLLVRACSTYSLYSYESLTRHLLGKRWRRAVEFFMLLFCQGTAVAYLIAVCDILQQSHLLLLESRVYTLLVVWLLVELPLSLNRKMTHLQMASALGIAAIFTLIFAALVHLLDDESVERKEEQDHKHDDDSSNNRTIGWTMHDMLWPNQGNVVAAIAACPIILFAFSCQVNVCSIFQELPSSSSSVVDAVDAIRTPQPVVRRLQENTQRQQQQQQQRLMMMSRVTISAVVLCTLLYASISAIVLLDFGPATSAKTPNLLQLYHLHNSNSNNHSNSTTDHDGGSDHDDADGNGNDKNSTSLMQVAALAMAVAVVVAFPLNIFPARVTLAGIFCSSSSTTSTSSSSSRRRTRDTIVGSLTTPTANETLTAALLEDYPQGREEESLSRKQQVLHEETATMTTTTCAATTRRKQNEADQEEEPEPLPPPASHSANDGVHECTVTNVVELSCFNHVALTLLLAGSALGMALVVPNISTVFSILGGTASSFLGFVIPGLLGLKLHEHDVAAAAELRLMRQEREPHQQEEDADQQPQRRRIYDEQHGSCLPVVLPWLLILFGIVMGILTTGATIYSLIHPS